jgi:cyclohexanone monooxygenase
MLAAVRLQRVAIKNIRIIERASDYGGTWYWNRHPDAQCDIEGYPYLPVLEEIGYIPGSRVVLKD